MTTALRAAFRNKRSDSSGSQDVSPGEAVPEDGSNLIKGLNFQSFFSGLVEGVSGLESILADMNPYRDPVAGTEYDCVTGLIRGVEQAFWNAGYSNKGNPYWADSNGLSARHIGNIIAAAMACLPILEERKQVLGVKVGDDTKDQKAFDEFVLRFDKFNDAITGFKGYLPHQPCARDRVIACGTVMTCALA